MDGQEADHTRSNEEQQSRTHQGQERIDRYRQRTSGSEIHRLELVAIVITVTMIVMAKVSQALILVCAINLCHFSGHFSSCSV